MVLKIQLRNRSRHRTTSAKKAPVVSVVEKGGVRIETASGKLTLKKKEFRDLMKRLPAKRIRIEVLEVSETKKVSGTKLVTAKLVTAIESPHLGDARAMHTFELKTARMLKNYGDSRRFKIVQMEA